MKIFSITGALSVRKHCCLSYLSLFSILGVIYPENSLWSESNLFTKIEDRTSNFYISFLCGLMITSKAVFPDLLRGLSPSLIEAVSGLQAQGYYFFLAFF